MRHLPQRRSRSELARLRAAAGSEVAGGRRARRDREGQRSRVLSGGVRRSLPRTGARPPGPWHRPSGVFGGGLLSRHHFGGTPSPPRSCRPRRPGPEGVAGAGRSRRSGLGVASLRKASREVLAASLGPPVQALDDGNMVGGGGIGGK